MSRFGSGLRPAFALLVIAHGLAHTMLPTREWMAPEMLKNDFMPLILYGVTIAGFILAGLGVMGVRPLTTAARPLMVIASAYSLVTLWRIGQVDLLGGAVIDVALLITGLVGAYNYLPASGKRVAS